MTIVSQHFDVIYYMDMATRCSKQSAVQHFTTQYLNDEGKSKEQYYRVHTH